jgi:hypothetical protein
VECLYIENEHSSTHCYKNIFLVSEQTTCRPSIAFSGRTDLSKSKTKEMKVHNITDTRLQLGVEKIEEVNEFVNLGSIIFKTGGSDTDIIARIKKQTLFSHNYHPYGYQNKFL